MKTRDAFIELAQSKPAHLETWAFSQEGRAILEQALSAEAPSSDEGRSPDAGWGHRKAYVVPVAVAATFAVLALALVQVLPLGPDVNSPSGATSELSNSYAFDVTDLRTLMANADGVAVVKIVSVVADNEESVTRTYGVEVVRPVVGRMSEGYAELNQRGYVDDAGVTHVPPDQALLEVGSRYLVVTGDDPQGPIVMAGPLSIRPVANVADEDELVRRYLSAAK